MMVNIWQSGNNYLELANVRISSLHLSCVSQGLNSSCLVRQKVPLPSESSCQPFSLPCGNFLLVSF